MIIFTRSYDGESIVDVDRDISEAFCEDYNQQIKAVPIDENGIHTGTFYVTIEWKQND